jgi:hypothetical protein
MVCIALLEHLVHEGGLAVVDMGDYRHVSYVFLYQSELPFLM